MGKNIKFFKKLTSLVLAGLTIFSSVPAKAWKEEDPRKNIEAEVRYKLQNGYSEITEKDIKSYNPKDFINFSKALLSLYIHPIYSHPIYMMYMLSVQTRYGVTL